MDNITASKTLHSKPFWNRLKQTSIVNKIYGGYGISLGIAVLGVLVGLGLGNHYHQTAKEQLRTAQIQGSLLAKLQLIAIE